MPIDLELTHICESRTRPMVFGSEAQSIFTLRVWSSKHLHPRIHACVCAYSRLSLHLQAPSLYSHGWGVGPQVTLVKCKWRRLGRPHSRVHLIHLIHSRVHLIQVPCRCKRLGRHSRVHLIQASPHTRLGTSNKSDTIHVPPHKRLR